MKLFVLETRALLRPAKAQKQNTHTHTHYPLPAIAGSGLWGAFSGYLTPWTKSNQAMRYTGRDHGNKEITVTVKCKRDSCGKCSHLAYFLPDLITPSLLLKTERQVIVLSFRPDNQCVLWNKNIGGRRWESETGIGDRWNITIHVIWFLLTWE